MNPGLHGQQLRTNRLRHDTAIQRFVYNPVMQRDFHTGILSLPLLATPRTHQCPSYTTCGHRLVNCIQGTGERARNLITFAFYHDTL